MGQNVISIIITIAIFALMAFLIYKSRQQRAERWMDRSGGSSFRTPGHASKGQTEKTSMDHITFHLEKLRQSAESDGDTSQEYQTHVLEALTAIRAQLIDLDRRLYVFEREAEEFKKSHVGLENP